MTIPSRLHILAALALCASAALAQSPDTAAPRPPLQTMPISAGGNPGVLQLVSEQQVLTVTASTYSTAGLELTLRETRDATSPGIRNEQVIFGLTPINAHGEVQLIVDISALDYINTAFDYCEKIPSPVSRLANQKLVYHHTAFTLELWPSNQCKTAKLSPPDGSLGSVFNVADMRRGISQVSALVSSSAR